MDSNIKFLNFLESLKTDENKALIEAVTTGYQSIRSLYESPDSIDISDEPRLVNDDNDARPFIYLPKKEQFYISKREEWHGDLIKSIIKKYIEANPESGKDLNKDKHELWTLFGFEDERGYPLGISGRLWFRRMIMSFWDYPTVDEFKTILGYLAKNGIIVNNKWRVEVYLPNDIDSVLIPVGKYTGKANVINDDRQVDLDKKREQHTLSPIEKEKQKRNTSPKELPVKKVDTGGLSMAEYNFKKNQDR